MLKAEGLGLKVQGVGFARYLEQNTNDVYRQRLCWKP